MANILKQSLITLKMCRYHDELWKHFAKARANRDIVPGCVFLVRAFDQHHKPSWNKINLNGALQTMIIFHGRISHLQLDWWPIPYPRTPQGSAGRAVSRYDISPLASSTEQRARAGSCEARRHLCLPIAKKCCLPLSLQTCASTSVSDTEPIASCSPSIVHSAVMLIVSFPLHITNLSFSVLIEKLTGTLTSGLEHNLRWILWVFNKACN